QQGGPVIGRGQPEPAPQPQRRPELGRARVGEPVLHARQAVGRLREGPGVGPGRGGQGGGRRRGPRPPRPTAGTTNGHGLGSTPAQGEFFKESFAGPPSVLMRMLRNATGSLWPAKPKWPALRSLPGCGELPMYSFTWARSASRMTLPFSSTRMVEPLTV